MNWIPFSRYNLGIFFSLENTNNNKKKKPAERVQQKSHLRVVHELGVAVAGGDCHVVKVVVSESPKSFFVGENWPKKKTNAKKDPPKNGKTLNPRRRALVKREKERGQESSLKQYKRRRRE